MSQNKELPPLPGSDYGLAFFDEGGMQDALAAGYTADQMQTYARAALAAQPNPFGWVISYTYMGEAKQSFHRHNAIGDYRDLDPSATSVAVYADARQPQVSKPA